MLSCFRKRSVAISRSLVESYGEVEGESGMIYQAHTATSILGNPSMMNNNRQLSITVWLPSLTMAKAKVLAKLLARGAAEMNSPVRKASSLLL